MSSGTAFRGTDIENAIKDIRTDIKTISEGESGWLIIKVGELGDDKSVDVTYSFVEAEYVESESPSPKKRKKWLTTRNSRCSVIEEIAARMDADRSVYYC